MIFKPEILLGIGVVYLLLLFLIAHATETGRIPERLVNNPVVYVLSLGVYATSWSYYGSVGFAEQQGFLFLTIYLGVTIAFLLSPLLLKPLLRLTRDYQLTSLADLFAFRYRSQSAGVIVTLFMLVGSLPYIALQIRAVTESLQVLTQETAHQTLALWFCVALITFAVLFGARHTSPREKHHGLVAAIAFESFIKLVALLIVGLFALFGIFSGPSGLGSWLAENPQATEALYAPMREGPWFTLIFLAFAAAFLLPRQFHMAFAENLSPRSLKSASWGFPLFLLLLNLAIPPILWAGQHLQLEMDADYFALGITLSRGPDWLPVLAFIGGLSAASAMVIVTTLALSSMSLNHLLLPASYPDPKVDLYRWLLWGRRFLIGVIIMSGFLFYRLLEHNEGLVQLGLISFVAVAQFIPGIVGALYWRRATRTGFNLGLLGGITVWTLTLLVPLLQNSGIINTNLDLEPLRASSNLGYWEFATFWSLSINVFLFVTGSLLTRQSDEEESAANACRSDAVIPLSGMVAARSPDQFIEGLAGIVGRSTARKEVQQALTDLGLNSDENRPAELRHLRERIERNLSGLVGPQMAHMIITQRLEMDSVAKTALADSMRYVEKRLEKSRLQLRGLAGDLDNLRRFHRQILLDLPLGVCTIDPEETVIIWNSAMETASGIDSSDAVGRYLSDLPSPWGGLLRGFALSQDEQIYRMELEIEDRPRWFNLHKARVVDTSSDTRGGSGSGLVILLEDLTDLETLEAELAHSDRLASVGRLAAGVAHEIGNPVTGIASLAQNLRGEEDPVVIEESIREILNQTQRISAIVRSLMNFSRSGSSGKVHQTFPVAEVVDEAIRLVQLTPHGHQIKFVRSCPDDLLLHGDRQGLSQVLVNLFTNASDASQPGDRVELIALSDGGQLRLEILDQGNGIPEKEKELVFEPFYTTKPAGEGTGLGLAMAYKIILDHDGSIDIDSEQGVGTRVVIDLPLRQSDEPNTDH
jgi:Na+/proline symporter/signal transduction histidine kinase